MTILAFEVSLSTEWQLFGPNMAYHPNYYVDVSSTIKIKTLETYQSEIHELPHTRSLKNLEYLG